jgi:mono/diheme cytochrome c family protein
MLTVVTLLYQITTNTMKKNRTISVILVLSTILILVTGFRSNDQPATGDDLYRRTCKPCHGSDGTRGMLGAKNLKISNLETTAIIDQIREGKGKMPSFKKKFSEDELAVLAGYVKSLRQ